MLFGVARIQVFNYEFIKWPYFFGFAYYFSISCWSIRKILKTWV